MGTCRDALNMIVCGMGLLFVMNNKLEEKGLKL